MASSRIPKLPVFRITKNAAIRGLFQIRDEDGMPRNIDGWTIRGGLRDSAERLLLVFTCSISNAAEGLVMYEASAAATGALEEKIGSVSFLFLGPAGVPLPLAYAKAVIKGGPTWESLA